MADEDRETVKERPSRWRGLRVVVLAGLVALVAAAAGVALLVNILQRKEEARNPFYRVVELTDETEDPAVWGKNFPLQYDGYVRTVDQVRTRYGGSEAEPHTPTQADPRSVVAQSRLQEDPRPKQMWAGYAFRSEEHKSELQSRQYLLCRLLLEKKKNTGRKTSRLTSISTIL